MTRPRAHFWPQLALPLAQKFAYPFLRAMRSRPKAAVSNRLSELPTLLVAAVFLGLETNITVAAKIRWPCSAAQTCLAGRFASSRVVFPIELQGR